MKPKIGITTGCPCGVGPEIVKKAINDPHVQEICDPKIFGPLRISKKYSPAECGSLSMSYVDEAVREAMQGGVDAIVTAPIKKSHWKAAGSPFGGHTEYLAHVSGAKSVAMMMVSPHLKVSLVTIHAALSEIPRLITKEKICEVARLTHLSLGRHGDTKIAICALNPHSGDEGMFGDEEERIIIPAIRELKYEGLNISGPWPADTIFWKAANGEFDAVVAMYHDQGLIPIKTLDFKRTVNVTLGLPFVRTSPDHGTAEDIAGKDIADHTNMVAALEMAAELWRGKCRL